MTLATTHKPGVIRWIDLSTPNVERAGAFYAGLLGWTADGGRFGNGESPVGRLDGQDVAGMTAAGAPAAWTTFVAVARIDETIARASAAGGTVRQPTLTLPHGQRVAVLQDPAGAAIGVVEGAPDVGAAVRDTLGAMCWSELLTRDPTAAEAFYVATFGWDAETTRYGPLPYTAFRLDGEDVAGMMPMPATVPPAAPAHWIVYFAVDDCAAACARASELGGTVLSGPMDTGDGRRFAVLADPDEAVFSVLETPNGDG